MERIQIAILALIFTACGGTDATRATSATPTGSPKGAAPAAAAPWWTSSVFYEIYPRSFQDSNGDGVGDLRGIASRLDYLAGLGVDAIWITPFYPSPQVDFGYDISDYRDVDPQFGTLADLDHLVAEAHRRHIRVVMDLVLNHTSDQHRFFRDSRSSRTARYRDFYVWHDPAPGGGPPNNWASCFDRSAWTLDRATGQYYYHGFYAAQPDLNWRNPAVEKEMFDTARWWFKRGIDGFRLDAINWAYEDPAMTDNPAPPEPRAGCPTEAFQVLLHNLNQPETHGMLARLRKVADEFPTRLLIGETYVPPAELVRYYGNNGDELHLPFNFALMGLHGLDAIAIRGKIDEVERALAGRPTTYVLDNHDNPRSYDRLGDGAHDDEIARLSLALLLTLRGSPFLYYGQELGMVTTVPKRREDVRDPIGKTFWPREKGRDGERTPMQWDTTASAGFTTGKPWLPVPTSAATHNVASETADPRSLLSWTRRLLQVRRGSPALSHGAYRSLGDDPHVFAYERRAPEQTVLVALNMSAAPARWPVPAGGYQILLRSHLDGAVGASDSLELAPFEAAVLAASGRPPGRPLSGPPAAPPR